MQLAKCHGGFRKDVIARSNGQLRAMRQHLQDEGFAGFKVVQLLVLPDHVPASTPVGFPPERIVDAKDAPAALFGEPLCGVSRSRRTHRQALPSGHPLTN